MKLMRILIMHRTCFTKTTLNKLEWLRTTAAAILSHTSLYCHFVQQRCSMRSEAGKNSSSSRHRDLAAVKAFDLFPAWTRASFRIAGQHVSKIQISWCCHPCRSCCHHASCEACHSRAGDRSASLNWFVNAISAFHSQILGTGFDGSQWCCTDLHQLQFGAAWQVAEN